MWQETARRQHGMITRRQLDALGLSDGQIDALRSRGDLVVDPHRRGLWRSASAPATALTEPWAAVLATDAVVSHRSAASVLGFGRAPRTEIHVTVGDRTRVRVPVGVRVHRIPLGEGDVQSMAGLPVTTSARTVIECLRFEPLRDGRELLDRALQRQWVTLDEIDRELHEFGGRWGSKKLRRLRVECAMGDAESERKLHRLLRQAGITGWIANGPVDLGFVVLHCDIVFPGIKLILELDGWATHVDPGRFRADRTRSNSASDAGWLVRRYTWHDVLDRPGYVIASVRRAIALRS